LRLPYIYNVNYDAVIVGSGPNGLAAAILLQQQGLSVLILEAKSTIGGGLRTEELTLPGYLHDVCSAIHPLAIASPFFKQLPLQKFGLEYITPPVQAAHPFDDGTAAVLWQSLDQTATGLGVDADAYKKIVQPLVKSWSKLSPQLLGPLNVTAHPLDMARFGIKGLLPAIQLNKRFATDAAKSLFAGMAAHSIQPLSNIATSAAGIMLLASAHIKGWPLPKGGSVHIANALAAYFKSLGGKIETGTPITSLKQLPQAKAYIFDVTPKQLLEIAGDEFSAVYKWQLKRYRYGAGVFKIDWALDEAIPFTAPDARKAGTVHIGGDYKEIYQSEKLMASSRHAEKPFVLLTQPSVFDDSRAPQGKHTAWAYCHVPNGSTVDMTAIIEQQVERFAPGFHERILARHTFNTRQMEQHNANYIGGDINGGVMDITQLFTRPVLRFSPYKTSAKGIYICSSSTPPGGGVHGMCGYHAAKSTLADVFNTKV